MKVSANKLAVLLLGASAMGWSAGVPQASAQSYPSRNITAIIPFAAGNANDVTARIVFEQLQKQLGQPIVIESKPGAGGTIGVGQAARANAGRLHHPVPFGDVQRVLRHAQDAALRHAQRLHAGERGRDFAERARGRAVEGLQDRRRSDRRRQGQAGRTQLRVRRHRRGVASCGREIPRRGRHQGPAHSVQGTGRSADRGDGGADRLLLPAACGGDRADQRTAR